MRTQFDEQLRQLNIELIRMGSMCEEAISVVAKFLEGDSKAPIERVFSLEHEIDQLEHDIESRCMRMLLQQQRLCIARALAVEPKVLLMDEPTSALDPISTSKIEELAVELKKDYTIVMVTHNMQQAARISDRTAFFLLGKMVEYGETEQIFSMPKDKRTEDYITGRFG